MIVPSTVCGPLVFSGSSAVTTDLVASPSTCRIMQKPIHRFWHSCSYFRVLNSSIPASLSLALLSVYLSLHGSLPCSPFSPCLSSALSLSLSLCLSLSPSLSVSLPPGCLPTHLCTCCSTYTNVPAGPTAPMGNARPMSLASGARAAKVLNRRHASVTRVCLGRRGKEPAHHTRVAEMHGA